MATAVEVYAGEFFKLIEPNQKLNSVDCVIDIEIVYTMINT